MKSLLMAILPVFSGAALAAASQILMFRLSAAQDRRTRSHNTRLDAAIEFFTACSSLHDSGLRVEGSRRMLHDAQKRLVNNRGDEEAMVIAKVIASTYKGMVDEREQERIRSRAALPAMRLGFRELRQECDDFWSTCARLDLTGDGIAEPQVVAEMRSSLEVGVNEILGMD